MSHSAILNRHLPDPKYARMFGYTVTLAVHALNSCHLINKFNTGEALKDPDVAYFWKYQLRMLTIWNVAAQIFYVILGLSCDVLSLSNEGKDSSLLKTLRSVRDLLFSAIVFPISLGVFTTFWSLYSYNPRVIIPAQMNKFLPSISNHVMHTFIAPVALWEVVCRPRKKPASHLLNLAVLNAFNVTFIFVLFQTLHESGQFPYPILNMLHGTPYLFGFLLLCAILHNLFYHLQWYITEFIYSNDKEEIKKVK